MCVVALSLSEASPLQKHRIKQNYPLFVAYKVIAMGHGRLPTFLFASPILPVYLVVSTEEYVQGGEALHRNSIITFSSLARRLEAQTAAVPSCPRSSLRTAPRSSLHPPPPSGLCLLHRTDAFCRQASALKETQATFLSTESLQWTEPLKQEQSPSFPASQSRA